MNLGEMIEGAALLGIRERVCSKRNDVASQTRATKAPLEDEPAND
jgi:hypothetical protein